MTNVSLNLKFTTVRVGLLRLITCNLFFVYNLSVMVQRYDIIVLGATGLTGKSVVKELALLSKEPDYLDLSWGIAGRSRNRLDTVLSDLEHTGEFLLKCLRQY